MRLAALLALSLAAAPALAQSSAPSSSTLGPAPSPGVRYNRLLIRNAMVVDGSGNPARGPMDIVVEGSTISSVRPARPINEFGTGDNATRPEARYDRVIDATGLYVTPGIVDLHGHIHFGRNRVPWPKDYTYKLWLGHGITTIREPGSGEGLDTTVAHAKASSENRIAAPTIIPYATVEAESADSARARV